MCTAEQELRPPKIAGLYSYSNQDKRDQALQQGPVSAFEHTMRSFHFQN
jgi:hypothetical protein